MAQSSRSMGGTEPHGFGLMYGLDSDSDGSLWLRQLETREVVDGDR